MDYNENKFQRPRPESVYTQHQLERLRKRIGTNEKASATLSLGLREVRRLCEAIDLPPEPTSEACEKYEEVISTNIVNNNSISMVASGVVYTICLKKDIPRRLEHVAVASTIPIWQEDQDESWGDSYRGSREAIAGRAYRAVAGVLGEVNTPISAREFVDWYCSELDVDQSVCQHATKIIDETKERIQTDGKPSVAAAGAVYFASTLVDESEITQRDVEDVSLVNVRGIRERYHEQMEWYTDNIDNFNIKSQPYVGDAPWMKPKDKQVLAQIANNTRGSTSLSYRFHRHYWGSNLSREKPLYEYGLIDIEEIWPRIWTSTKYHGQKRSLIYIAKFKISTYGNQYLVGDLDPNPLDKTHVWPGYSKITKYVSENEFPTWTELRDNAGFSFGLISSARTRGYITKAQGGYAVTDEYQNILSK